MADDLIDIEGFEKYGPALNSNIATFVADNANIMRVHNGQTLMRFQGFFQEWEYISGSTGSSIGLITGRAGGSSTALCNADGSGNNTFLGRTLGGNYSRIIFGFAFVGSLGNKAGIEWSETIGGGAQVCLYIDSSGRINFARGSVAAPASLYQSGVLFLTNAWHYVEVDFTISSTVGRFTIWLDGVQLTASASNQNTRGSGTNNFVNYFQIMSISSVGGWDDMYWRDNTTGTALPYGDCTIDRLAVTANSSVQFSPAATILGTRYNQATTSTNAPGANFLAVVAVTPATNMTINSVSTLPQASSNTAKFKGVIYSDNAGAPGSLLSSGTEVISCFIGRPITLPLTSPQALTSGTQYWIGYITDTSVVLQQSDIITSVGQKKANTYTGGAPAGPLSSMTTGQANWSFWGNCTNGSNFDTVNKTPSPLILGIPAAYTSSSTAGQKDYYTANQLPVIPNRVYAVKVSTLAQRSASGPRTMNIRVKTGVTEATGSLSGITPGTMMQWYASQFIKDPATNFEWGVGAINTLKIGYEVAT